MTLNLANITVGLVPLARSTFDIALANHLVSQIYTQLEDAGFLLIGPKRLIVDITEASTVSKELSENPPDLLLILQATFSDSTMILKLAQNIDAPILLWALPEARTGERLRLNSLCGINLAAHALTREGYDYDYVYAVPDDPATLERISTLARAGLLKHLLTRARIGRVGVHPDGFDSCNFSQDRLKSRFGLEVVQVKLERVFQAVRNASQNNIETLRLQLHEKLDGLDELDQTALRGTLGTYLALKQISKDEKLDGLGVRCWPEFFDELGCAACGAMSMLSDEMIPCSCEADINGTITQLILQWLSGKPSFSSDLVSIDNDENTAILWHCGLAPLSMADPAIRPRGTIHSNRNLPLLMEFPLRPGRITIARLSEATGDFRLVIGSGEILQEQMSFSGTSGVLRFDRPVSEVLNRIMKDGLEHHMAITYGDHVAALLSLARILELQVVRL